MISFFISSGFIQYCNRKTLRLLLVYLIMASVISYWKLYENSLESIPQIASTLPVVPKHFKTPSTFGRQPENRHRQNYRIANYARPSKKSKSNSKKSKQAKRRKSNSPKSQAKSEKLILMYTTWYRGMSLTWDTNFSKCRFKCRATANRSLVNQSDAVIFSPIRLHSQKIKIPPRGPTLQNQIRIIAIIEPPGILATNYRMSRYDNQFNWTLTYRRDSDLYLPANRIVALKRNQKPVHSIPTLEIVKKKRLVAAMNKHCPSPGGREKYIAEFRKHAPLDHYGRCGDGNHTCRIGINCYPVLAKKYKFWLSFENSLCKEYITEKLFQPMLHGMVPVVYGMGPYAEIAPKGSYIDVRDFETPKALAEYLLYLDKHPEEYLKYFDWTKHFSLRDSSWNYRLGVGYLPNGIPRFWCKLCEKLHKIDFNRDRKWYPSFDKWYHFNNTKSPMCVKPPIPIRKV